MTDLQGPLRISARNPRYFEDAAGRIVVLAGAHTWNSLHDIGPKDAVVRFDWQAYLDLLVANGHNFIRLWAYDSLATWNPADVVLTCPWRRPGPGVAWDGGPRLDLEQPDPAFYARLRERVSAAAERDIWVSVMLFECWSSFVQNETPLAAHMFAAGNNINDIDILIESREGTHPAWSGLTSRAVLAIQERHAAAVVDAIGDLPNVLYEIANEGGPASHDWLDHLTARIRALEAARGACHPVGQTGGMHMLAARLHGSDADWVSPDAHALDTLAMGYRTGHYAWGDGPSETADRPLIVDTDHLWGVGGSVAWVWKTMLRGYNLLYMDPWTDQPSAFFRHPRWPAASDPAIRRAMGAARGLLERLNLGRARPADRICSTGYCTADPGSAYLVFNPEDGPFSLELPAGAWRLEWRRPNAAFDDAPATQTDAVTRRGTSEFASPWAGPAVMLVSAASPST